MYFIDQVVPLLGSPFDENSIERIFGVRGKELLTQYEPGHPEDQRRYYILRQFGLQILIDSAGVVDSIFFMIDGDENIAPYPWSFSKGGLNGSSKRVEVLAALGKPDRSSQAELDDPFAPGGWDRFITAFGFIHVQYKALTAGISMVTFMRSAPESAAR